MNKSIYKRIHKVRHFITRKFASLFFLQTEQIQRNMHMNDKVWTDIKIFIITSTISQSEYCICTLKFLYQYYISLLSIVQNSCP
jgi:hypothetical protein